jgi:hypothetical protein
MDNNISPTAELIKADTALNSFRDSGFSFEDTIGEYCDNSIQASATEFRVNWLLEQDGKKASQKKAISIAIADNGGGIAENLLPNCLTIGFGTRLNDRTGIGKYGVGFKLATLNQGKRLVVYSKPRFLQAAKHVSETDGSVSWTYAEPNKNGEIFKTYLDLDDILAGTQTQYSVEKCDGFPAEYAELMCDKDGNEYDNGCLFVLEKLDRFNERKSYAENIDQKFLDLVKFISRAFRIYIDNGLKVFIGEKQDTPVFPYDPSFEIENNYKEWLIDNRSKEEKNEVYDICKRLGVDVSFKGKTVESDEFPIDNFKVKWSVNLVPEITRLGEGFGGKDFYKKNDEYFNKLNIPDNEGKVSFLRQDREISYTVVPRLFPGGVERVDRYIGVTISFPADLDEYFQVRHIKRGAEPVDKLREKIKNALAKPIADARKEIRALWKVTNQEKQPKPSEGGDFSGGRTSAQESVKDVDISLPKGPAGSTVSAAQEHDELKKIAEEHGIKDPKEQEVFASKAKQSPIIAVERSWPGKGLIDIRHLTNTVVVYLNSNHPFIKKVYLPLKAALQDSSLPYNVSSTLKNAIDGIDLLLFAYAKAENQSMDPEEDFGVLREDWGKFASVYLKKMEEVDVR